MVLLKLTTFLVAPDGRDDIIQIERSLSVSTPPINNLVFPTSVFSVYEYVVPALSVLALSRILSFFEISYLRGRLATLTTFVVAAPNYHYHLLLFTLLVPRGS